MDAADKNNVLSHANNHVGQINNLFRSYKSNTGIDCIRESWNGITVTTNQVASSSDLSIIEKYFKGLNNIVSSDITPQLPQSKSFLKILGVPYFGNNSSAPINVTQVEEIISKTLMFNEITLAARPRVIRASRNSDMSVIWIDIWDSQNGSKAKALINRSFNFGQHIATIRGTTMNPGVPQCRNC